MTNEEKTVYEIVTKCEETYEDFIFETIYPYCEGVTKLKLNKERLKRLLLLGLEKEKELGL